MIQIPTKTKAFFLRLTLAGCLPKILPFIGPDKIFPHKVGRRAAILIAICSGFSKPKIAGHLWETCLKTSRGFGRRNMPLFKSLPILHKKVSFIVVFCRILEQTCLVIKKSQHIWFGMFLSLEIELQRSGWFLFFFLSLSLSIYIKTYIYVHISGSWNIHFSMILSIGSWTKALHRKWL